VNDLMHILNQVYKSNHSIFFLLLLYKENLLKRGYSAGGLPLLFFRKSQEKLLSDLKPQHTSTIGIEYHGQVGYLWHDFLLQADYYGLRRIFHTLEPMNQNKQQFGGKLEALKTLYSTVDYSFNANSFTYWIECDSVKGNNFSLFFTPRDRAMFKSSQAMNRFAWCLNRFNLKSNGLIKELQIIELANIAVITDKCGGFITEIGYLNRGEGLQHIKLLVGNITEHEYQSHKYINDITFVAKILSMIKKESALQVLSPCMEQVFESIGSCNPQALFVSISVFSTFISLEIEVYPPNDTSYVDDKEKKLSQDYMNFWDKIMSISGMSFPGICEYTRYTRIDENYSIEDKWNHVKFTRKYTPENNNIKLYRKIRILSR